MTEFRTILMLGAGSAGARAAYYVYQRCGSADEYRALRFMGMDTDRGVLDQFPMMDCRLLPPAPALPAGHSADAAREATAAILRDFKSIDLLLVLSCLGGATTTFYCQEIMDYARRENIPVAAVVGMPHADDSEEIRHRAATTLSILQAQHFDVLPLDCAGKHALFPRREPGESRQQAIIWLGNTALGYARLFCEAVKSSGAGGAEEDGETAVPEEDANLPRGIFSCVKQTFHACIDLDVPTCLRRKLALPLNDGEGVKEK